MMTRYRSEGWARSGLEGVVVKALLAKGLTWERSMAWVAGMDAAINSARQLA